MYFAKKLGTLFLVLSIVSGLLFLKPIDSVYAAAPPTATVEVAKQSLKIGDTSLVTITFSEAVSGFDNADLSVDNGTLSNVSSIDGGSTWTATFTPNANMTKATNNITLDNAGVWNGSGAGTGTTDSNNYAIDTVRPTATIVVTDTSLYTGETSTVTITFSEAVIGFDYGDLTIANGTISDLRTSDNISWTMTFTPARGIIEATNVITLNKTGVIDGAGNVGIGTTDSTNYVIDTARPTATIEVIDTSLTTGETSLVTITFSEAVTDFTNDDLTIANGMLSTVSSSNGGVVWEATFTPDLGVTDETNLITLDNTGVRTGLGFAGTGTTDSNDYAIDTARPTGTIEVADTSLIIGETSLVTITFSEAVTDFTNDDLTIANGTLSTVSSSDGGIVWEATFTPTDSITATTNVITLDQTGVSDLVGNVGDGETDSNNYAIDTARPTATIEIADTSLVIGETSLVTITFSEAVTDFTNDDLTVANGTLSMVSSSNDDMVWTATFTPQANVNTTSNLITLDNTGIGGLAGNTGQGITESNPYSVSTVPVTNGGSSTPTAPINNTVITTNGKITLPIGTPGVVSLGNEIQISIPAAASLQELKLSIEKVLNTEPLLTNNEVLASPVFEVLKNFSENFIKPVKLTLPFGPASLKSDQTVAVFYYDEVKMAWVKVEGGIIKDNQITVEVTHFTKYAVLVVDKTTGMPVIDKPAVNFSDISGHWAESSIKQAVSGGIVTGYPDGTFKPENTVTRAEFSVMLMNALKSQEAGAELIFTDTAEISSWAKKAVSQAVQNGIINGYEDGTFRPNANITRAEMAMLIANALMLPTEGIAATPFADDKAIPSWAKGSVAALKELDIVKGMGANEFNPSAQTTRAEAVIVLMNMLEQSK
ncbi:MAG: Ig-like domain-containing protein [Candidatus Pristimantibacillus sp.]